MSDPGALVRASAVSKVILFGEHAVVYGYPAIAIPFSGLRAYVEMHPRPLGSGIDLMLADLGIRLAVSSDSGSAHPLALALLKFIDHYDLPLPDVVIRVWSEIPSGSGLGSGAAVAVALLRGMAAWCRVNIPLSTLNDMAYEVERMHHGTPSGIDNTVIVYETPVWFVRGASVEHLQVGSSFQFLLVDTGVSASTKEAVSAVRELLTWDPEGVGSILAQIGDLAVSARVELSERGCVDLLGRLMLRNHELLRYLSVSSPLLDSVVEVAMSAGAYGAKLSGGGLGGNAVVLVDPVVSSKVSSALKSLGVRSVWEFSLGVQ